MLNIDDIANIVIPFVYSAPVDGIFGNKEEFFLFRTEGAADYCVIEEFYVSFVVVPYISLIDDFFRNGFFV